MSLSAKQAHRALGAFIGIFLAVHLAAHFAALGGIGAQEIVLQWGRKVYRVPLVEIALLAALAAQVAIGIKLLRGIARRPRKDRWHWLQFLSGTYLAYFMVVHTTAAIVTREAFDLDTNFFWAAGTLVLAPIRYGFAPYYVLAVAALATHIIAALHFRGVRRWHGPALLAGPIAGAVIVAAYSGALYLIELPTEYRDYFAIFPGVDD